jgi:hypothetical protein
MSPELLPSIAGTRAIAQSLAMLDAILCPEWECRYYSFNCRWAPGEEMASMRNGSGDDWFLLFDANGAALKGVAHELAGDDRFAQEIQRQVPREFGSFLNEAAFSMQNATYCYWRRTSDAFWTKVSGAPADDGSNEMLSVLIRGPSGYKEWAEAYLEVPVDLTAVSEVFAHQPLTEATVHALNPETDLPFAYEQAEEIGYPRGAT